MALYGALPHAFGRAGWLTLRVTTNGELDAALVVVSQSNQAAYVEVVTDTYAASDLARNLHEAVKTLYR
jgi:indolepyruvate decarboxylase